MKYKFKKGDLVNWTDPETKVTKAFQVLKRMANKILLIGDGFTETEVFEKELSLVKGSNPFQKDYFTYYVDYPIKTWNRATVRLKAHDRKEADKIIKRYAEGDFANKRNGDYVEWEILSEIQTTIENTKGSPVYEISYAPNESEEAADFEEDKFKYTTIFQNWDKETEKKWYDQKK